MVAGLQCLTFLLKVASPIAQSSEVTTAKVRTQTFVACFGSFTFSAMSALLLFIREAGRICLFYSVMQKACNSITDAFPILDA